jgi:hypothetical protein
MKSIQVLLVILLVTACYSSLKLPPAPKDPIVARGRELFFNETFGGNGRTCGSCHRAENNFTIDSAFISTLPANDALFVAEFNPELKENFENPKLMREFGLIMENLDGFDSLATKFTMRGVPHTLGLRHSIASRNGPHAGWSGDGAPGDRSLRSFATGAVIQHFTKTLRRVPGVDFRLPTEEELIALEAFQLSLGRQEELILPIPLKNNDAIRGQSLFNNRDSGKCFICHFNAGANANPDIFGPGVGNLNFNTGVEDLPDARPDPTEFLIPFDDGFGVPGDSTFNTPSLVEAAETGPFFHNNAVATIEEAVAFYGGDAFNNSPSGQRNPISLDSIQIRAISVFLRVINSIENLRQSKELLNAYINRDFSGSEVFDSLPKRAAHEINDAIRVLSHAGLHPQAITHLKKALSSIEEPAKRRSELKENIREALAELELGRKELIQTE